jgi:ABC-type glycerol-3-phosphate transport system substrate-binding protein
MHASPAVPPHGPVRSVRKPLRPAVAALAVITLAAALAACGSRMAGASGSPVEKPDLTVAVVPATGAAGAYIAARDGYFTAPGLQVKIVAVTSSAAVMTLGSYPPDVTVPDLERVGDLVQQEHALKASANVTQLVRELAR